MNENIKKETKSAEHMNIPDFLANGNLPPGIYIVSFEGFIKKYGINYCRNSQLKGLERAIVEFKNGGATKIFVDGSFVSNKINPGDFDVVYDLDEIDDNRIDKLLLDSSIHGRKLQKIHYGGEFFPMSNRADRLGTSFINYFQKDKKTKDPKGIIQIDLR